MRSGIMRRTIAFVVASVAFCASVGGTLAQGARCHGGASFSQWLEAFKRDAAAQGVTRNTIAAASPYLAFDSGIINKDRGQSVFQQTFLEFAGRMVNGRMASGPARIRQNAALLKRIEEKFGVPPGPIVAFWGLETDFGANNGNLPVLKSIATLAYDCRRHELFKEELLSALRVIQRGDIRPDQMIGAWAGEIGQTQFSASAYWKYAVDFDGDGRRDLIHSIPDVLASSANHLAQGGWKRGEPWLQEVRVPAQMKWEEADLAIKHPRSQWAAWGVTQPNGSPLQSDAMPTALLLPMGRLGPAFLAHTNFYAFLEWNQSLVYATTAAYYASRLAGAPAVRRGNGSPAKLAATQISELQRLLTRAGFDPGKADGKLGLATRKAVKQAQLKFGIPADSYPTPDLLARLR